MRKRARPDRFFRCALVVKYEMVPGQENKYRKGGARVRKEIEALVVKNFRRVRDMPFEIRMGEKGCREDLAYIKENKRGSCSPKHYLLGFFCENVGLEVIYLTYPFRWRDLEVNYPSELKKLAIEMPLSYHLNISVGETGKNRYLLDATWDSLLFSAGFPVNKIGGNLMDTSNGVLPCGEAMICSSASEREALMREINKARSSMYQKEVKFYTLFNKWLKMLRQENRQG